MEGSGVGKGGRYMRRGVDVDVWLFKLKSLDELISTMSWDIWDVSCV